MSLNPRVLQLHTNEQLRAALVRVGAESSETSLSEKIARGTFHILKLEAVSLPLARLLYQELVMEGGQVVTAARLEHSGPGTTDVLLCATRYQFAHLFVRLRWQPEEELHLLADELERTLDNFEQVSFTSTQIGPTNFAWGSRTYVMGILNVTPDSFSGDGLIQPGDSTEQSIARIVARGQQFIDDGADLLDIGGESTHPNAEPVDANTEMARLLPVIEALAKEVRVPLSVDTYKAQVARAALAAGAHLVNDVWGLGFDLDMKRAVAESGAAVVIMHNWSRRPDEATPPREQSGDDFIGAIMRELRAQVETALQAGVRAERILIDPGLGFGKTVEQNLQIVSHLSEFKSLGYPILIGPSRKGFISRTLEVPIDQRAEGTAAAISVGITRGADMIRVHDVKIMTRVARMTDAMIR